MWSPQLRFVLELGCDNESEFNVHNDLSVSINTILTDCKGITVLYKVSLLEEVNSWLCEPLYFEGSHQSLAFLSIG